MRIQSLEQVYDLPGVAADESFTAELDAKKGYFSALKCAAIARSHAILSNRTNALALFHRALTRTVSAPSFPNNPSIPSHKGLEITSSEGKQLREQLENEVARFRALVEMDLLAAKASKSGSTGVLVEKLDQYPTGKVDFENGIVQWPPKVALIPVKPVFLDVAFNFIEYPGEGKTKTENKAEEKADKTEGKKAGFLGSLWGR
jgi:signal recognition particle subunit SRP68